MSSENTPTLKHLITHGLHYCCLWAFFSLFRRTQVIADRLGVSRRSVCRYKSRFRAGEYSCEKNPSCMYAALLKAGKARERRRPKADDAAPGR